MIQPHVRTDPAALLEALRRCGRRGDLEAALECCAALVDCGEWRKVWETAERWLRLAGEMASVPDGRTGRMPIPNNVALSSTRVAARAANAFRLLAPVAGRAVCGVCGRLHDIGWACLDDRGAGAAPCPLPEHSAVTNPLPRYVEALRLWWPDGWWRWFKHERNLLLPLLQRSMPQDVERRRHTKIPTGNVVYEDGRVTAGKTCGHKLPFVPDQQFEPLRERECTACCGEGWNPKEYGDGPCIVCGGAGTRWTT